MSTGPTTGNGDGVRERTVLEPALQADLTVDQLAEHCRVSVRLVRAHQSRRLLHPPRRVGRRSVYDHSHIDRLELIQRLQRAGFSLAAIRALLQTGHNAPELALAWHAEGLAMRFPSLADTSDPSLQVEPEGVADLHAQPGAWEALESYGLVSRDSDGNWYGTHPVLVAVGRRARELGMPSTEITRLQLRVAAAALELSREIIESFNGIFAATEVGAERTLEDYASMSSVATALITATFEVQLSRLVRGVVGIPSDAPND
ncbi:MerR family transcriptional regulator [Cryptosporangium sp. NPDC051539]|uniref:MerR family transcriptional regulator n=1 Tax=Cryptosporangium sp. NPDC051539 TaxID=3363962 RepID=UPI00379BC25F